MNGKTIALMGAGGFALWYFTKGEDQTIDPLPAKPTPETTGPQNPVPSKTETVPPVAVMPPAVKNPQEPAPISNGNAFEIKLANIDKEYSGFHPNIITKKPQFRFVGDIEMTNATDREIFVKSLILVTPLNYGDDDVTEITDSDADGPWGPRESKTIHIYKGLNHIGENGQVLTPEEILKTLKFKVII